MSKQTPVPRMTLHERARRLLLQRCPDGPIPDWHVALVVLCLIEEEDGYYE